MPGIVVRNWQSQSCSSKWSQGLIHWLNIYLNISTTRFIPLWNSLSRSRSLFPCSVCVCVWKCVRFAFCSCLLESGVSLCHHMTNTVALCGPYLLCGAAVSFQRHNGPEGPHAPLIPLIFVVPVQNHADLVWSVVAFRRIKGPAQRHKIDPPWSPSSKKKKIPCQCQEINLYDSFSSLQAKKTRESFLSLRWGYIVAFNRGFCLSPSAT